MTIHFWYSESRHAACHQLGNDTALFGEQAYELVDCDMCRRILGWPDPDMFPNLSTHPNYVTNREPRVWCEDAKNQVPHERHWHTIMAGNITVAGGQCEGYHHGR